MLYNEIICCFSEIHIRHKNTLCGQDVGFLNTNVALCVVATLT
jgi:hypothetical protein